MSISLSYNAGSGLLMNDTRHGIAMRGSYLPGHVLPDAVRRNAPGGANAKAG
jgi:hypothetical protein